MQAIPLLFYQKKNVKHSGVKYLGFSDIKELYSEPVQAEMDKL
jgi:hypothetical protein